MSRNVRAPTSAVWIDGVLTSRHRGSQGLVIMKKSAARDDFLPAEDDVEGLRVALRRRIDAEGAEMSREVCYDEDICGTFWLNCVAHNKS